MSTIQASNISDGTDTVGTEYVINGSAKSWVNFNGTGTVSIRESFNVSSITDNGTGDYTTAFSNVFASSNYSSVGMSGDTDTFVAARTTLGILSVGSGNLRLLNTNQGNIGASAKDDTDVEFNNFSANGDLA